MSAESLVQTPPIFSESFQRRHGLILFSGLMGSGVEETVSSLSRTLKGRQALLWGGEKERAQAAADAVLVVQAQGVSASLDEILSEAEAGRLVVWIQHAPGPITALRRVLSRQEGAGRGHLLWRLADQLILAAGQMRLRAMAPKDWTEAYEILLMTPALREALARENFEILEESLKKNEEGSGVVSFNQSLLQLLLRRSIDIKTAFEATRDPVNLDQILKKVGI